MHTLAFPAPAAPALGSAAEPAARACAWRARPALRAGRLRPLPPGLRAADQRQPAPASRLRAALEAGGGARHGCRVDLTGERGAGGIGAAGGGGGRGGGGDDDAWF